MINHNENEDQNKKQITQSEINRPWSRHKHKFSKYKKSRYDDTYMYQTTTKQHLHLNS